MNFKTTYILFGILALVLLLFAWTLWVGPTNTEATAYVLPSMHKEGSPLEPKDITRVEIERRKGDAVEKFVFARAGAGSPWRIVEPRDYPADGMAIDSLVRQIYNARLDEKADVVNSPKQYGLETPAEVITLIKEGEPNREVKINVGETSLGSEKAVIYVTSSDRKEVMAVKKSELDSVKKPLAEFRSRELLSPSSGDIDAFSLAETDKSKDIKKPLALKKIAEERWVYVRPPYGDAQDKGGSPAGGDKAPENVEAVLTDLSNLKVEDAKAFVQDDAQDLGKYNLDPAKNAILRIEVERVESIDKDEKGEKSKKTKKIALLVGIGAKVGDKKDQYYAYLDDPKHKDIVAVAANNVAPLLKLMDKPDALRDRNLAAFGGFRKPDALDVQNSFGLLEFRRSGTSTSPPPFGGMPPQETWKLWRGDKEYAVDNAAMQALLNTLTAPNQVEGFEDDPAMRAKLGLDKPDAVVRIWADGLAAEDKKDQKDDKKEDKKDKKPEPKDKGKPAYTLSFGNLREGKAAVERKRGEEKTGTIVLIPAKARDLVREGLLAYLDKQLPPFNDNRFDALANVTKLTLLRDGTTFEISRENKPDAPWKIDKPSDFAGRTADSAAIASILGDLNNLHAVKIVADKIEPAKLADWGLKNPRLKAVVTRMQDGKPKTFEFDFGNETSDKSGVYLRVSQQDMIVVAGNNVVSDLQRELQDPAIFSFDPAKVKAVKLTGWSALQKKRGISQPDVLEAKRDKNGTDWTVETPKGFKLDANKLNDFLRDLSALKAMKFVAHKATASATHGLDVNKDDALQIEITVEGEKTPLSLTVGKPDGDAAYFAISNKLPGDLVDVSKSIFDKAREGPGYFSK
jgi:hypothetical protein